MKNNTTKTTKKVSVVELPLTELKERLYRVYNDAEMVYTIISASYMCYDVNGLYISYNKFNDLFTVKVTNPKYAAITKKYAYNNKNSKKILKNNRILNIIIILSLIINTVFSILALCANLYTDYNMWFLLWATAQINIIAFTFSTIKRRINNRPKRYK